MSDHVDVPMVLRVLDYHNLSVRLVNGELMAGPGRFLTDEMADLIRYYKQAILAELQERERLAQTITNVLSLCEEQQQQWAREVQDTAPGEPHFDHDHRALREVARMRQAAKDAAAFQEGIAA